MWPGQSLETSERWVEMFPISSSKGETWKECQILAAATNTVNEKRWDTNTQRRGTHQNKGILCWWLALRCDHFGANKTKVTVGAKKDAQNLLAHYHCEICPTLSNTIWAKLCSSCEAQNVPWCPAIWAVIICDHLWSSVIYLPNRFQISRHIPNGWSWSWRRPSRASSSIKHVMFECCYGRPPAHKGQWMFQVFLWAWGSTGWFSSKANQTGQAACWTKCSTELCYWYWSKKKEHHARCSCNNFKTHAFLVRQCVTCPLKIPPAHFASCSMPQWSTVCSWHGRHFGYRIYSCNLKYAYYANLFAGENCVANHLQCFQSELIVHAYALQQCKCLSNSNTHEFNSHQFPFSCCFAMLCCEATPGLEG